MDHPENVAAGLTAAQAAKEEAFEEAGIKGSIDSAIPLGSYTYGKRLASGEVRPAVVEVYLLKSTRQVRKWREKGQRTLAWVSIEQAITRNGEPGLQPLLHRLLELEKTLVKAIWLRQASGSVVERAKYRVSARARAR